MFSSRRSLIEAEATADDEHDEEPVVPSKRGRSDLPAEASDPTDDLPDSTCSDLALSARNEVIIALELKLDYSGAKLARREATIRILKAALAAANVVPPPLQESQQSQGNEMSEIEQVWLDPSNEKERLLARIAELEDVLYKNLESSQESSLTVESSSGLTADLGELGA